MASSIRTVLPYDGAQKVGVTFKRPKSSTYKNTHMYGYLITLLVVNILQSIGTVMNFGWVAKGRVIQGSVCSAQGGIEQAGNVGTSIWSLVIAIHLFNLLFLRVRSTKVMFIITTCSVWSFVTTIILVGRFAIQKPEKGPYFGISGAWCWITTNYPHEQIFLEYIFSFISAGINFILYIPVLLRVRGNLIKDDSKKWRLRFVPPGDDWKLAFGRDISMLRVAQKMVWYPVVYTVMVFPITVTRLLEMDGNRVPFWATAIAAVIFNLMGFANVILVIYFDRCFLGTSALPDFATRREVIPHSLAKAGGNIPFSVKHNETQQKYPLDRAQVQRIAVNLPIRPQNTYIPPEEWK